MIVKLPPEVWAMFVRLAETRDQRRAEFLAAALREKALREKAA